MARWLFKQEPSCYSYSDLERDGQTTWDGVGNALALIHLRKVRRGDRIFLYHSGKEKAVVAEMKAIKANEGVVEVAPVRRLDRPVTLAELKSQPKLANWELIRISRLSVMPVSDDQWRLIEALSQSDASD